MKKFRFSFNLSNKRGVRLTQALACRQDCSNSACQSIAATIVEHLPLIPPSKELISTNQPAYVIDPEHPWMEYFHPYFEPWTNFINKTIIQGRAVYYDETLFVDIPIEQEDAFVQLKQNNLFEQFDPKHLMEVQHNKRIASIFGIPVIEKKNKKMGIFINTPLSKNTDPFGPQVNSIALFLGILFNNQQWHTFVITDGEIPSAQEISTFDGIVIPGSSCSVISYIPEVVQGINNLMKAYEINKKLRIIGVCFGHQLIAHYFKAKLVKKDRKGGLETVRFDQKLIEKYDFFNPIVKKSQYVLSQHHEDYVEQVPQNFMLVANSPSCQVEMLLSKDTRILTTQFHSEFFAKFTNAHQKRTIHYTKANNLKLFHIESSEELEDINAEHSQLFLQAFRLFLAGE